MAASTASKILPRIPVVVVLGATGTGKSKLAIEIAQKYGGEIISADSMQVYHGLDIVTNKVTAAERDLVKHHLIDCVSPLARFTVVDFRNRALPIVEDLLDQGKLPVIVGGTNYYIESILWKILLDRDSGEEEEGNSKTLLYDRDRKRESDSTSSIPSPKQARLDEDGADDSLMKDLVFSQDGANHVTTAQLHRMLGRVDPEMAAVLHPNNRRKIMRSLEVWQQYGRPHSELLKEQRELDGGCSLGGPLRYANTIIFWIQCDKEVLDKRLDDRVDEMLRNGLLDELAAFHQFYNQDRITQNKIADYTTGIFQSIGFKEFHEYLVLPPSEQQDERGQKLFGQGVDALKLVTRRYARKQLKWIQNRFLKLPDRQVPPVYPVDATDVAQWNDKVRDVAFHVMDSVLQDEEPTLLKPLPVTEGHRVEQRAFHCEVCQKTAIGERQWKDHLNSRTHHKRLRKTKEKSVNHPLTEPDDLGAKSE